MPVSFTSFRLPSARPRTRRVAAPVFKFLQGLRGKIVPTPSEGEILANELLIACEVTDRGLDTSPEQRAVINDLVDRLAELGASTVTTDESISATWKLLWTTEKVCWVGTHSRLLFALSLGSRHTPYRQALKNRLNYECRAQETLFIVKNAGFFGTTAGEVYQVWIWS